MNTDGTDEPALLYYIFRITRVFRRVVIIFRVRFSVLRRVTITGLLIYVVESGN